MFAAEGLQKAWRRDALAELSRIQVNDIRRIEVGDLKGPAGRLTLTDLDTLAAFVKACSDVET